MTGKKITERGKRFTRLQTSEELGVKTGTLAVWASTGRYNLPYFKCGRKVYYFESDINAFIEKRMRGGEA